MDTTEGAPAATAGISLTDHTAALTKASTDAAAAAGKAAQARIQSILGSDEAKGRAEMANHLAFETDMSAEASIALLAKSPKGEAPKVAPTIQERQELALGGAAPRSDSKAKVELNAADIYAGRANARSARAPI